jgi:hypothetical protein
MRNDIILSHNILLSKKIRNTLADTADRPYKLLIHCADAVSGNRVLPTNWIKTAIAYPLL